MKNRFAFTIIELIFVIVVIGILAKFGVGFMAQAYKGFLYENVNHTLQSESEQAVEFIAKRLEYRIKDSVIARTKIGGLPEPIGSINPAINNYTVLEWIGVDNDGFRGKTTPYWSGIIDLNSSSASILTSQGTDTKAINNLIKELSNQKTTIADAALYFVGSNSDAKGDYGWSGNNLAHINSQKGAIHPIKSVAGNTAQFQSSTGSNFSGVDVYEYYKLAWTAYAIVMTDYDKAEKTGTLKLYYNYQPWLDKDGDSLTDQLNKAPNVKSSIIMENVSDFQFLSVGSIMKIKVCTKSKVLKKDGGDYSLCKEKTIF